MSLLPAHMDANTSLYANVGVWSSFEDTGLFFSVIRYDGVSADKKRCLVHTPSVTCNWMDWNVHALARIPLDELYYGKPTLDNPFGF